MVVKNPKFVISAVCPAQYPDSELLEIAFAGRSNSSFHRYIIKEPMSLEVLWKTVPAS